LSKNPKHWPIGHIWGCPAKICTVVYSFCCFLLKSLFVSHYHSIKTASKQKNCRAVPLFFSSGLVWPHLVWSGLTWSGLMSYCLVWPDLIRCDWSHPRCSLFWLLLPYKRGLRILINLCLELRGHLISEFLQKKYAPSYIQISLFSLLIIVSSIKDFNK